jgi:hypothetical protein
METSLFQEIFSALMSTIIVPILLLLLFSIFTYNYLRMSRIELELEKDCIKTKVRTFLELNGFSYDKDIVPYIEWIHVDGPFIITFSGGLHWLTYWDRFLLFTRLSSVDKLNIKYCNELLNSYKRIVTIPKPDLRKMTWVTSRLK